MKKVILLFILLLIFNKGFSQDLVNLDNMKSSVKFSNASSAPLIEFKVQWLKSDQVSEVKSDQIEKDNVFNETIARKKYLLDLTYTYKTAIAPGNPAQKTMFRKPVIYNSVLSIERHLRKKIRKENFSTEQANYLFNTVLDVALNVFSSNTENFEKIIDNTKNAEDLIALFTQRVVVIKVN